MCPAAVPWADSGQLLAVPSIAAFLCCKIKQMTPGGSTLLFGCLCSVPPCPAPNAEAPNRDNQSSVSLLSQGPSPAAGACSAEHLLGCSARGELINTSDHLSSSSSQSGAGDALAEGTASSARSLSRPLGVRCCRSSKVNKLLLQITLMKWLLLESQTQRELTDWLPVMSYPAQLSTAPIPMFSSVFCVYSFHLLPAIKAHQQSLSPRECGGGSGQSGVAFVPLPRAEPQANSSHPQRHCGLLLLSKPQQSVFLGGWQRNWHFGACTYLKSFYQRDFAVHRRRLKARLS